MRACWTTLRGAALAASLVLLPSVASAIPMLTGLGGPTGYGPNLLHPNDDESSALIDVSTAFPGGLWFFGTVYRGLYLNNNGNVTFRGALGVYTPQRFPVASQPMIAPWWGDVDTRNTTPRPARNAVWWSVTPGRFVATWASVGYYSQHNDHENSFQLILLDRSDRNPGDFDVEFRYERCEWTTGDASGGTGGFGGTPAQAGFDGGNTRDFFALPGSFTMSILDVCRTTNAGTAGLWRFQIRSGMVAECGNGRVETGEECDDSNTRSGDGCSAMCRVEGRDAGVDVPVFDVAFDARRDVFGDVDWNLDVPVPPDLVTPRDAPRSDVVKPQPDVVTPPDDRPDASTPPPDAGECHGFAWRCGRDNRLDGRAGPLGGCTVQPVHRGGHPTALALGALAILASWRRRRGVHPTG